MRVRFFLLFVPLLVVATAAWADSQNSQEQDGIPVIVRDRQGEQVEGYLRLDPKEITVSTKDNQEKSVPVKWIESIKVEKIQSSIPGADQMSGEEYYSVRLQNSQELFMLRKKYTFSVNTSVGVVTRMIDPELILKDSSSAANSKNGQPLIRDKNVIFSLEIKF